MTKLESDQRLILCEYHRGHLVNSVSPLDLNKSRKDGTERPDKARGARHSIVSSAVALLRSAFLPEGYPESVSSDYLSFQVWDTIQALSSYVRGMLTSQAILRGVGVGQQASTPLAAVFMFFVRDLAGMLGGILFAYLEGSSFDSCAKQWRLFADITNDVGMTMELASPLLPRPMFLPLACFGSIARSVTGVAGGATRAALTQHFARRGNAADVSAKEQSQETATTILGMVAGMLVTRLLAAGEVAHGGQDGGGGGGGGGGGAPSLSSLVAAWLVFGSLTVLHVWANVRAMRVLVLASLNQPRLELLVGRYLQDGVVLPPVAVSRLEDLTPPPFRRLMDTLTGTSRRQRVVLHFGSRPTAVLRFACGDGKHRGQEGGLAGGQQPFEALQQLLVRQGRRRYLLLSARPTHKGGPAPADPAAVHLHCLMHRHSTPADQLRAFVHAHCLAQQLAAVNSHGTAPDDDAAAATAAAAVGPAAAGNAAERAAEDWMAQQYDTMVSELQAAGWRTERVTLPRPAWMAEWWSAEGEEQGGGLHED